ncbi:MAG: pyridoxine 5'-phosphate synthase [Nitrospiraceae bacterium]|nr:pyridoxine 5'-phosphate synthase [Nitrospiraceae bacterium]
MRKVRLGVNIDHVATLRNVRGGVEPDPVYAAVLADLAGADQITLHVREDRRHTNERDLRLIKAVVHLPINLEMAPTDEMVRIALSEKPHQVTVVPEKRQELTTEGGLDVASDSRRIADVVKRMHESGIRVNLFVDPDEEQIKASKEVGADSTELHTGRYSNAFESRRNKAIEEEIKRLKDNAKLAKSLNLGVVAGHGLNYRNVQPIAAIPEIEELNIGHSIIANAVFRGLTEAIKDMIRLIQASN